MDNVVTLLMTFQRLTFRPSPDTTPHLPLGVRAVGHYQWQPPRSINHHKHFFQFYWGIRGEGTFRLEGRDYRLRPNHVFLYLPDQPHHYWAVSAEWEFSFLALDGQAGASILKALNLAGPPRPAPEYPRRLFEQLHTIVPSPVPQAEQQAATIAFEILQLTSLPLSETGSGEADRIKELIDHKGLDPQFGVEQIAAELDIHRSTLYRHFRNHYDVTPSQYLSRLRITHALQLLRQPDISLHQAAEASGFADFSYFGKVIRRATGYTPGQLRDLHTLSR